ncbi:uncharacterized protein LOC131801750 [Musca domestica]|uniref:Uncharacterized protein LOC131801750 n=1 Tax=Musca domestica TaxID=7370 RepID=A0ABM3UT15_MUSDO|nr:uncharacterized protein LOC131801750 [Musca domestica]
MWNIRKILIGFVAIGVVCQLSLAKGFEDNDNNNDDVRNIRVRRSTKNKEEKEDKYTKPKDTASSRSQLLNQEVNNPELAIEQPQGNSVEFSGKYLGFPNDAAVYPPSYSFLRAPMPAYASSFPYPGLAGLPPPQQMRQNFARPPLNTFGYFFGNPSFQANAITPFIQNGNSFGRPQPGPQLPSPVGIPQYPVSGAPMPQLPVSAGPYANNFMSYGNQQQLQQQQPQPQIPLQPQQLQPQPAVQPFVAPQYSVHNLQTGPASLQLQAFAQHQPEQFNPMARADFGLPPVLLANYPRYQRSLKQAKKD